MHNMIVADRPRVLQSRQFTKEKAFAWHPQLLASLSNNEGKKCRAVTTNPA
jgi:hypothetical protein